MNTFQLTVEDIKQTLRANSLRITNSNGIPFETMADILYNDVESENPVSYGDIEKILVNMGVIESFND